MLFNIQQIISNYDIRNSIFYSDDCFQYFKKYDKNIIEEIFKLQ